jgi:hypothetical protein
MDSIIKEDISFIQLFKEFVANQMEAYNYNRKWIIKIKSCSIKSIYYRLASEIRLKKRRSFNIPFIKGVIHLEDDQIDIIIL